jgi:hypothetical protein
MSEAVKEICFFFYLLRRMFIEMKLPIIVGCDNMGAIFIAEKLSFGVCTRHIDTRYHFVLEHIVNDFIKIIVVHADVLTKNVSKDDYTKDVRNFLGKKDDLHD